MFSRSFSDVSIRETAAAILSSAQTTSRTARCLFHFQVSSKLFQTSREPDSAPRRFRGAEADAGLAGGVDRGVQLPFP